MIRVDDDSLFDWIGDFVIVNRYAPTVREVSKFLGVNLSTAHHRLAKLRDGGRITWNEGETRTLRIVESNDAEPSSVGRGSATSLSVQGS